jgi:hypothetical protein
MTWVRISDVPLSVDGIDLLSEAMLELARATLLVSLYGSQTGAEKYVEHFGRCRLDVDGEPVIRV